MSSPHWRKYPRTPHHPDSPGVASDDKVATDLSAFAGAEVVATEKMDGENTTLYRDGFHARSLDSGAHPSRSRLAALHAAVAADIPEGWRVCGENVFARHAIAYGSLPGHFLGFSVWTADDLCLSWDETVEWLTLLGIPTVPVLYRGPWAPALVRDLASVIDTDRQEGFVLRTAGAFPMRDFPRHVVKWVRAGHVQTDTHWRDAPLVPNGVAEAP